MYEITKQQDPELYSALEGEYSRQCDKIELIASENFTSRAVMEVQGSQKTLPEKDLNNYLVPNM
jgi:glycine hydroxymethyltransferase